MAFDTLDTTLDPANALKPAAPVPVAPSTPKPRSTVSAMIAPPAPIIQSAQPAALALQVQPQQAPANNIDAYMRAAQAHESGGNDKAVNARTNATGRYQFLPSTWDDLIRQHPELGLRHEDIWDGAKQDIAMRAFTADNAAVLAKQGIAATPPNLFMLSFLGSGAGPKFLQAMQQNPSAAAAPMFSLEAEYNPSVFYGQGGQPRSLSEVYALLTKGFGGAMNAQPVVTDQTPKRYADSGQIRSDAVVDAPETIVPPPPPGFKLAPLRVPPPPPGFKLKYNDAAPMQSNAASPPAAPYSTNAKGELVANPFAGKTVAKSDSNATPGDPGADMITGDPTSAAGSDPTPRENTKGLLAGMALDVTGPASLLPNWLGGGYAQRATNALNEAGNPTARKVGEALPMLIPGGEIAGVTRGGLKAFEAGEALLPSIGRGAAAGALGGAAAGSTGSASDTDYGQRLKEKARPVLESSAAGALGGAAAPAVLAGGRLAAKEIGSIAKTVTGGYARDAAKAAEELRTGVSAETGKALTAEEKAARLAAIDKRIASKQAAAEEETAKAAQAAHKDVTERHAAREQMREEDFSKHATEAAMTREQTLENKRLEASKFAERVKLDGGKPSIPTNDIKVDVNGRSMTLEQWAKSTNSDDVAQALNKITPKLQKGALVQNGKAVPGVSIQQMRDTLEDLNGYIENSSPSAQHQLKPLYKALRDRMESRWDEMRMAREEYAKASRDLDPFRDKGPLAKVTDTDPYSGKSRLEALKRQQLVTANTPEAAAELKKLVADKPEVADSLKKMWNRELFAPKGEARTPTEAQFAQFFKSNERALEATGLKGEFEALRNERLAADKAAEALPKDMRKTKTPIEKTIDEMASAKTKAETARRDFKQFQSSIDKVEPRQVPAAASSAIEKLHKSGYLTDKQLDDFNAQIRGAQDRFKDADKASHFIRFVLIPLAAAAAGAVGFKGATEIVSHRMRP